MTESVTIVTPTGAAPAGHDEKMAAAFDAAQAAAAAAANGAAPAAQEAPAAERPSWLPEKFASVEDMAKAYAELEGKQAKPAEPATEAPATPAEAEKAVGTEAMAKFNAEYAEKGELSPESYAELAAKGFDKQTVDIYVNGLKASAAAYETTVKSAVGTEADFTAMVEWATANASDAQLAAYNTAVNSGNADLAKLGAQGLFAAFRAAQPAEPNLVSGTGTGAVADVYESVAQMRADMGKPEYKADPAFRAKVAAKLGRSNIL